ncbi:MAG: 3-phosphoshikimate 1-carboxyvinyltransferase [Rubripirellula sp.]
MPESHSEVSPRSASVEVIPGGSVHGTIRPPGSKSLTNRALICAAFADGPSILRGALRSEDTEVMIEALASIGVQVSVADGGRTLSVTGKRAAGDPAEPLSSTGSRQLELYIANSGTSIRFLAAALSAAGGSFRLHGVDRMHQRPIGDLVAAVEPVIDGTIVAINPDGCPPVEIRSAGWVGREIEVAGAVSSQYLSGLMMAAPIATAQNSSNSNAASQNAAAPDSPTSHVAADQECGGDMRIAVLGELVSRPYVDMTAEVMRSFGAVVEVQETGLRSGESLSVVIAEQGYRGTDYLIEPDASAASYFWATAAITGGEITVEGLNRDAMQGDVGFCEALRQMGCDVTYGDEAITVVGKPLKGIDIDMNQISDTVQTLAVVALFADGPTRVRGVAHNRFKETDRIGDLACEIRKLGAEVDEHEDGLTIRPPNESSLLHGATLETYHDHRMAMSLSLAGLRIEGVRILDPSCTSKTYPEYFHDLERLIGRAHRWHSA